LLLNLALVTKTVFWAYAEPAMAMSSATAEIKVNSLFMGAPFG
jgi:hypothetical protein